MSGDGCEVFCGREQRLLCFYQSGGEARLLLSTLKPAWTGRGFSTLSTAQPALSHACTGALCEFPPVKPVAEKPQSRPQLGVCDSTILTHAAPRSCHVFSNVVPAAADELDSMRPFLRNQRSMISRLCALSCILVKRRTTKHDGQGNKEAASSPGLPIFACFCF